jgi:hypothetical protein
MGRVNLELLSVRLAQGHLEETVKKLNGTVNELLTGLLAERTKEGVDEEATVSVLRGKRDGA